MSLELAPRGHPRGSASVRRPPRIRSRAFSAPQRFLQARASRPCFMPQPFLRSTPFRGFPSQESRAPLPLEFMTRLPETRSVGSTPLAPLWLFALLSLRDRLCPSQPVSSTPELEANTSAPSRLPVSPDGYGALSESSPLCTAASPPQSTVSSTLPGRRERRSIGSTVETEDPNAAQAWLRPLRSLVPPASPFARAEVAFDTRSILSWVFTPL